MTKFEIEEKIVDMLKTVFDPEIPVRQKVESIDGVNSATINLVFEPEWDKDMMSEEAKLELGFL